MRRSEASCPKQLISMQGNENAAAIATTSARRIGETLHQEERDSDRIVFPVGRSKFDSSIWRGREFSETGYSFPEQTNAAGPFAACQPSGRSGK